VDSELVEKGLPCDECGSSDALASYTDGHTYCFSCKAVKGGAGKGGPRTPMSKDAAETAQKIAELRDGSEPRSLPDWKITQATARYADYRTKVAGPGKGYHIATYKDDNGQPCFCKVRVVTPDNPKLDFFGVGDQSRVSLLGIEKLGAGGQMVVVTEGEKDYLTGLQLWNCKFPVVSIPFGAESSGKAFAKAIPQLIRYDKVVLALDMDEQGRAGALELAKMLPPGKAYIADFQEKDLSDEHLKHGLDAAKRALFNATPYQPDGVLDADVVDGKMDEEPQWGNPCPFPELTEWTYGYKGGQVWVGGAGTSAGKSDWSAQFVANHIRPVEDGGVGQRAAMFNYESEDVDTLRIVLAKLRRKNFTVPAPRDPSIPNVYWSPEDWADARSYRREKCGKLFINDYEGVISWDAVKERIRYLFFAWRVTLFVVDPMAALVAGEADDRKALDRLLAEAKALAKELNVTIFFWSHLARAGDGPGHEEGGQVRIHQFRGSGAITMWADVVLGIERNQQAEDEVERCTATCRMLKCRPAGRNTGNLFSAFYNSLTGVLEPQAVKSTQEEPDEPLAPED
jgi:twinkle protein